ncbi:FAD-binding oxidoreductase [Candidatus Woesearchaeota archaeon]|nr:FAD-binding oxidoreductase [Candidatus Woesearchaeota archaeon]
MKDYDAIIIGAGIAGSCVAYNLIRDGYKGKVLVIDRDVPAGEKSSTALSAGGFRNLWTTEPNMKLSTFSIKEYEKLQKEEKMNIGFDKAGYLFLKNKKQWKEAKKIAKTQKKNGVNLDILTLKEVSKLIPDLNLKKVDKEIKEFFGIEDLAGGIIGHDCGFIDGYLLSTSILGKAKQEGISLKVNAEVTEIIKKDNTIEGIKTKQGETILSPVIINAAGPYAAKIGAMIGVEIPVVPINRQLFVATSPYKGTKFPMIVLDNGAYMRSELEDLLFGRANKDEPVAKEVNGQFLMHSDKNYFMEHIYPYFLARLPALEKGMSLKSKWGGLYEVNTEDHNAIIGQHPDIKGFYMCCGFSGHGIMEGFAAGKCISDLIIKGDYVTLPEVKQLRYERFKEGQLIKELEVI